MVCIRNRCTPFVFCHRYEHVHNRGEPIPYHMQSWAQLWTLDVSRRSLTPAAPLIWEEVLEVATGNRQTRDTTLCNYDKWVLSCAVLSWHRGRLGWNCHRGSPTSWVMHLSCPALNYCCQFTGCGISSLHKVTPDLQLTKFTVMNKMTETVGKQLWSPL